MFALKRVRVPVFCYARNGTYLFRNVRSRHIQNLEYVMKYPEVWFEQMLGEVQKAKDDW
jgi:hypothetical protein